MKKFKKRKIIIPITLILSICIGTYCYFNSEKVINQPITDNELINYDYTTLLVNYENKLPDDYETVIQDYKPPKGSKVEVSAVIVEALNSLFEAADQDGLNLTINSAYRSYEDQEVIMNNKIFSLEEKGYDEDESVEIAKNYVAIAGYSEHQTGLAVDLGCYGNTTWDICYDWLEENAYKYGFIYRFPEDKVEITKINNEPWHYRYVGEQMAEKIYESGLCLEEYLEQYG
ncbi:MAG: M15 family metallopeptidase [Clostridia bacterium]